MTNSLKIYFLIAISFVSFSSFSVTTTTNEIKITIEDIADVAKTDLDANDIVMCTNWSYKSVTGNANLIQNATFSLTPVAAGAINSNAIYIKNPCEGSGIIELKRLEDTCSTAPRRTIVSVKGETVLLTSSFTRHGFSSDCSQSSYVNVASESEQCAPNKSYVIISCDAGSEFTIADGVFPYADLFTIDSHGDGLGGADDVDASTIVDGFASVIIGDCADPTPEERLILLMHLIYAEVTRLRIVYQMQKHVVIQLNQNLQQKDRPVGKVLAT